MWKINWFFPPAIRTIFCLFFFALALVQIRHHQVQTNSTKEKDKERKHKQMIRSPKELIGIKSVRAIWNNTSQCWEMGGNTFDVYHLIKSRYLGCEFDKSRKVWVIPLGNDAVASQDMQKLTDDCNIYLNLICSRKRKRSQTEAR